MRQSDVMAFGAFALLMLVLVANLMLARNGSAIFGNVTEMLILFGAVTSFGVGTLIRESRRQD